MGTTSRHFPELTRRGFVRAAGAGLGVALLSSLGRPVVASRTPGNPADESSFVGIVTDLSSGSPIAGAVVRADPSGATAETDRSGAYRLALPPGLYRLTATASGYVSLALGERALEPGTPTVASIALIRLGLSPDEEDAVYAKLRLQVESPRPEAPLERTLPALSLPSTIVVRHEVAPGVYVDTPVPLEDYVKGVVPNEVPYTWPTETLKAQSVAARSYGVATYLALGYVWDDTRSQVYDPTRRTAQTDAAVDATSGVVVTYLGSVAQTPFFSRCNGVTTRASERALDWRHCLVAPWGYLGYCRAQPCCGHPVQSNGCTGEAAGYIGHGVGMCQWGAWAGGQSGASYQAILQSYYTNVAVQAPAQFAAAQPLPGGYHVFLPVVGNSHARCPASP